MNGKHVVTIIVTLFCMIPMMLHGEAQNIPPADAPVLHLKHRQELDRTVSEGGECSYPGIICQKNIEHYFRKADAKSSSFIDELWVNTDIRIKRFGYQSHRKALAEFDAFLKKPAAQLHTGQFLSGILRIFDDALDYESEFIGTLPTAYPGVDRYKTIYTMDGQDFPGGIAVRILARKGNTVLMMDGTIPDVITNLNQDRYLKQCYPEGVWPNTWKLTDKEQAVVIKCYMKAIKEDSEIQKAIQQKAADLVSLFSLEP